MAPAQGKDRAVEVYHPNREIAAVQGTRAVVVLLLLASAGLMILVAIGGWNALAGQQAVQIGFIIIYLLLAYYAARWSRGALAFSMVIAIILGIIALVAAPSWFDRNHVGFASTALPADVLGLFTILLVPIQILLIFFAVRGFGQGWNVEEERPVRTDLGPARPRPA